MTFYMTTSGEYFSTYQITLDPLKRGMSNAKLGPMKVNKTITTLNITYLMKESNIKCKLKYYIATMVICGSYMHEFSVSKDMKKKINNDKRRREVAVKKVATHLCLTLIIKELKISVEHDGVVTILNTIRH